MNNDRSLGFWDPKPGCQPKRVEDRSRSWLSNGAAASSIRSRRPILD